MSNSSELIASDIKRLPVIPLRNMVLYPGVVQPIDVGRPRSLAISDKAAMTAGMRIAVIAQRKPELEDPQNADLFSVGVEAEVLRVMKVANNRATVVVRGLHRIHAVKIDVAEDGLLWGDFTVVPETNSNEVETQALALAVKDSAKQLIAIAPEIPDESAALLEQIREPARIADIAASHLDGTIDERMALLEQVDISLRLKEVLTRLQRALETYRVKEHIESHVRAEMGKHQREAVLRQRMRAIQEELGDSDDEDVAAEFEERLIEAAMPPEVEEVAQKQIHRLRQIPSQSPEHTVTRTYLEWLVDLPWNKATPDNLDLERARTILDEDHYGLDKVKKRIIEYLAVRKLKPDKKGPILCLVGPPGVGKTSTGRSVARALERKFVRASLGGVRDEAEIRGHRRTYVGALPGRILQSIRRAGTKNPVFVLDEIDKLGHDFRGDPSSALLEVLDPEQNHSFSDHFLEVPFDLSQVLFFATANDIAPIPAALKDRLEILEIPGYTRSEKLFICNRHLIPKQIEEHGLTPEQFPITDGAVLGVIDSYTREAGVRNLEREIGAVCRSVAVKIAEGGDQVATGIAPITEEKLFDVLGPIRFYPDVAERTEVPGVATGLAWTPVGGEIIFIEASRMKGTGRLILTGQLGDVMKESAQAALSYTRARALQLGLEIDFLSKYDIHIHVPAGATPKDGPSAGITMIVALISLLTDRRVYGDIAMTGEISLRGKVMPIGGVKEKVLAAHRAGIRRVLLPEHNRKDVIDIPADVRSELEILFVDSVDDAVRLAIEGGDKKTRKKRSHSPATSSAAQPAF